MEVAPLSLAHSHARNAALETHKANPTAASEEHDLAAGEFANAAKNTSDNEALRTLRLLEQHHLRLAEILKVHPDEASSMTSRSMSPQPTETLLEAQLQPTTASAATSSPIQRTAQPASPGLQLHRESSSTLASNLATARGISSSRRRPGTQSLAQLSTQTAEGRVVNPRRHSKLGEHEIRSVPEEREPGPPALAPSRPRLSDPDVNLASPTRAPPPPVTSMMTEDPFSRFYSTFNNLITTLSAPLAFAGLPLNPAEAASQPTVNTTEKGPQTQPGGKPAAPAPRADPDLARIFSRAALRAVRDEHGLGAPAESFYVVPTTGGTMSYAGMLSHARHGSNLTDEDGDAEFVDARETPTRGSPEHSRHARHRRTGSAIEAARRAPVGANKTWEELAVENDTLKNVVVDLGDRLRAFELGAQKSSLALHASMRHFSSPSASTAVPGTGKIPPLPGSAGGPLSGLGVATKALEERSRELDEELKAVKKDNRRLGRENQKYLGVIEKYRERWEALKEGARERVKGAVTSTATAAEAKAGAEDQQTA